MSRQERRLVERQFLKARKVLQRAQRNPGTEPLVFVGGYVHTVCGGDAERATKYREAWCARCDRTVPIEETERAK